MGIVQGVKHTNNSKQRFSEKIGFIRVLPIVIMIRSHADTTPFSVGIIIKLLKESYFQYR